MHPTTTIAMSIKSIGHQDEPFLYGQRTHTNAEICRDISFWLLFWTAGSSVANTRYLKRLLRDTENQQGNQEKQNGRE